VHSWHGPVDASSSRPLDNHVLLVEITASPCGIKRDEILCPPRFRRDDDELSHLWRIDPRIERAESLP
jgi:hypothetical protein